MKFFKATILTLGIFFLKANLLVAQVGNVGIGTTQPDKSAILDLSSESQGFLLPRMSLQQRTNIQFPAKGLLVYQTDFLSGVYIYNGSDWSPLSALEAKATAADAQWLTSGNAGLTEASFLGTTDSAPLVFKTNNLFSGKIDASLNNVFLGYRSGMLTQGINSVIIGSQAVQRASTGNDNIAIGFQTMFNHQKGRYNISIGSSALATNENGERNTIIGAFAGYRSEGSGNIFIGYQAGYFEKESNKLYINNNSSANPLLYGDFAKQFIGINTSLPGNNLTINSTEINNSGLQFLNLTSASPTKASNSKVLSVDAIGNVILVPDLGTTQVVQGTDSNWEVSTTDIINKNTGNVKVKNNLIVDKILDTRRIEVGNGGVVFKQLTNLSPVLAATGKVLTVDNSGNVILVPDQTGITAVPTVENYWKQTGNRLEPAKTAMKVVIGDGITQLPDNYSLFVSKGILAEHVRVAVPNSAKWADYVFDKKYVLMPLSEVEQYIHRFHHLPNMLSAEEMAAGGMDVMEMNAKLLEKVEELTIYAIEADKRLKALEERLEKLEKK